ncbi:hypothetical protein J18TS1_28580 [Oceanobacillus oncorhynchi subsp. incaldanensis]|uniref:YtkA-like domain-containing protein n=2 Tax=Oceanobacillus TaxID=182709 RepID=A0A0A1MM71_9BACI|nr:DUF2606 family protein [Oceanobacillus oncorhynchi]MDM8099371.1 DUF2606 family protein [Oceanobacillus oncorhynchi]GIO19758.1 hypothetical protein J18TS1_28580 [Oceanobacillus oncorhynchi subsp. incaldanensis]CEI84188.1 hypothetical protein BN997_04131 [Oceanobacillus oncorhynchi]
MIRLLSCLTIFFLVLFGCQQEESSNEANLQSGVVFIILNKDQSPVENFTITIVQTSEPSPDIGVKPKPTDVNGRTEMELAEGETYEAALVISDYTTQYEEFTVSEDKKDNEFTFILEN